MSFLERLFGRGYVRGAAEPYPPLPVFPPRSEQTAKPYTMAMVDGENAEITMYGEIVEAQPVDWWTGERIEGAFIVQTEFLKDLEEVAGAKTLTIRMDSIGGNAGVSILIHNRLRDMAAKGTKLKCIVDGVAMSGGSLIMCACDEVEVNPSSLVMIHKCWGSLWGGYNADELRALASEYDAWDKAQVSIYKRKCSLSDQVISNMMAKTTYMTGAEAVEKGFADKLLEDAEPLDIAASADKRSLFVRGRQFHLAPGMFAPDTIPTVKTGAPAPAKTNTHTPAPAGSEGGNTTMAKNLEELRAENPALADALMAEALIACQAKAAGSAPAGGGTSTPQPAPEAAVQAERKRIQEIDAVAALYDADTVQAAKYGENACTVQEMTYRAAQKAAQQGKKFLGDLEDDAKASGAQGVPAAGDPGNPSPAESQTPDQRMASARAQVKALFGKEEK